MNYYVERLKAKDFDVVKWLTEDVVRQFGIAVSLRDESNLSFEQILQKLEKFDEKTIEDMTKAATVLDEEPLSLEDMKKDFQENVVYYNKVNESAEKTKEVMLKVKQQLDEMISKNTDRDMLICSVLASGLKYIENEIQECDRTISQTSQYLDQCYNNLDAYIQNRIDCHKQDIEYNEKKRLEALEELKNYERRAEIYKHLVDRLNDLASEKV